jgi:hypothetical protein
MNLFEQRFWLQIMGDHSRFIFFSLAPTESIYIQKAQDFIILFDQLLAEARSLSPTSDMSGLNRKAFDITLQLKEFKTILLASTLRSDIKEHLSSSFYNDMLNELDEYLTILNLLMHEESPMFHPIHYHTLWLTDAVGHAASVASTLDLIEKDMIEKAQCFEKQFVALNFKSLIMHGYLRTQMSSFPSLDRLNEQVNLLITEFMEFLEYLCNQRMDAKILGTLMPLMADHMAREECYYLWKLSQVSNNVRKPNCDPTRPRMEV